MKAYLVGEIKRYRNPFKSNKLSFFSGDSLKKKNSKTSSGKQSTEFNLFESRKAADAFRLAMPNHQVLTLFQVETNNVYKHQSPRYRSVSPRVRESMLQAEYKMVALNQVDFLP